VYHAFPCTTLFPTGGKPDEESSLLDLRPFGRRDFRQRGASGPRVREAGSHGQRGEDAEEKVTRFLKGQFGGRTLTGCGPLFYPEHLDPRHSTGRPPVFAHHPHKERGGRPDLF